MAIIKETIRDIHNLHVYRTRKAHTDLNYRTIASLAGNLFAGCSACSCVAIQYLKDLGHYQTSGLLNHMEQFWQARN